MRLLLSAFFLAVILIFAPGQGVTQINCETGLTCVPNPIISGTAQLTSPVTQLNGGSGATSLGAGMVTPSVGVISGIIPSPLSNIAGRVLSVTDFGALCNDAHDDTADIQAAESAAEKQTDANGQAYALQFPAGQICLASTIIISRSIAWVSSGTKQAWIEQISNDSGTVVPVNQITNLNYSLACAFIVVSLAYDPAHGDPQTNGYPLAQVVFSNLSIVGAKPNDLGCTSGQNNVSPYGNMGVALTAATTNPTKTQWVYFVNTTISQFRNHLLEAYGGTVDGVTQQAGIIRGYNLVLWNGGTNSDCLLIDTENNPYRFYNLVAESCYNGVVVNASDGIAFYGLTSFSNANNGFRVTGTPNGGSGNARLGASVVMYNAEVNNNGVSNYYIDPQGGTETVHCFWCRSQKTQVAGDPVSSADVEIGPDGTGLVFSADGFQFTDVTNGGTQNQNYNVLFDGPPTGPPCACTASLQGTLSRSLSQILTNEPQLLTGPAFLVGAPPILDGDPMNGTPGWGNGIVVPQGRLTLTSGAAFGDQTGVSDIYYTDTVGQHVPVFNGTNLVAQNVHTYFMQTIGTPTSVSEITNVGDINEINSIRAAGGTVHVDGPDVGGNATVASAAPGGTAEGSTSSVTTTPGSAVLTTTSAFPAGIQPGWGISGTDLPNGSYVTTVNSSTKITINQPALTMDTSATVVFVSGGTVTLGSGSVQVGATGTQLVFSANVGDLQLLLDANEAANTLYDLFVTMNPTDNIPTLCAGPAWANSLAGSSSRGTTAQVRQLMGLWVNKTPVPCRFGYPADDTTSSFQCPATQCTYVGTMYAVAAGETSFTINPAAAAGGTDNCICLYNAYNPLQIVATEQDSSAQYPYTSSTWRAMEGSTNNRIQIVDGLGQMSFWATLMDQIQSVSNDSAAIGIVEDGSPSSPSLKAHQANDYAASITVPLRVIPLLGYHQLQAMESGGTHGPLFGNGSGYQALTVQANE